MTNLDKHLARSVYKDQARPDRKNRPKRNGRSRSAKVVFTRDGQYAISRDPICSSTTTVYSVWEPSTIGLLRLGDSDPPHRHHTIRTFDNAINAKRWGRLSTRQLPPELESLPAMTEERSRAVSTWRRELENESYRLIRWAFPEVAKTTNCRESGGEIVCH